MSNVDDVEVYISPLEYNVKKYIGISIVAVVIGALVYVTASSWVDYFRNLVDDTYFESRHKEHKTLSSLITAISYTLITTLVIIVIFCWYRRIHMDSKTYNKEV